jgi:hypothetical protein
MKYPDGTQMYFCTQCKEECTVKYEDEGIGAYDYHGATGVDEKLVAYSLCCDVFVTTDLPGEDDES